MEHMFWWKCNVKYYSNGHSWKQFIEEWIDVCEPYDISMQVSNSL